MTLETIGRFADVVVPTTTGTDVVVPAAAPGTDVVVSAVDGTVVR